MILTCGGCAVGGNVSVSCFEARLFAHRNHGDGDDGHPGGGREDLVGGRAVPAGVSAP